MSAAVALCEIYRQTLYGSALLDDFLRAICICCLIRCSPAHKSFPRLLWLFYLWLVKVSIGRLA